jgi:dethiobiotin synthetase
MPAYFITGTDTEIGKTHVTVALLRAARAKGLRCVGMKPVASGCVPQPDGSLLNEDVEAHRAASSVHPPRALTNPYAFVPPVSPHLAAAWAGVKPDLGCIAEALTALRAEAELVLVEGAGGWLAPLDDQHTMADLAARLDLPVILVVGLRLGCLNHAMLTAEAIRARACPLVGWVGNAVDPDMQFRDENVAYLTQHLAAPCLALMPHVGAKNESNQVQMLDKALQALV